MTKDVIHDEVKAALENDGWTVTAEHYTVRYEELTIFPDPAAERMLAAQRGPQKIAVEVKSFLGRSTVQEVRDAIGQLCIKPTWQRLSRSEKCIWPSVRKPIMIPFNSKRYSGLFNAFVCC